MKNQKFNLFEKFELKENQLNSLIGGNYTENGQDTLGAGSQYDVITKTHEPDGTYNDSHDTSSGDNTMDKPLPGISNSFTMS